MGIHFYKGFTYHDFSEASIDEVVAHFNLSGGRSSGTAYARKTGTKQRPLKDSGRGRIAALYDSKKWPMPLKILSMPGISKWKFERQLLGGRGFFQKQYKGILSYPLAETSIISIEREEIVFRAALKDIPGIEENLTIVGSRAVSTPLIHRFICMDLEEYITHDLCPFFDAAWFDLIGPLTERFIESAEHFWKRNCGLHLTVTSLKARWNEKIGRKIKYSGNVGSFLSNLLDANILNEYEYFDKVPMHQVTLVKKAPAMNYFGYEPYSRDVLMQLLGVKL